MGIIFRVSEKRDHRINIHDVPVEVLKICVGLRLFICTSILIDIYFNTLIRDIHICIYGSKL